MDLDWIQIVLAARNNDGEGWTNILFIVVMGVIWLVGGILKARANKVRKDEFEQEHKHPQETRQARIQRQEQLRRAHMEEVGSQFAVVKETPRTPPFERPVDLVEQKPVRPKPKPRKKVSIEPTRLSVKTSKNDFLPIDSKLELDSPDQLKKAILYHEILGKPVGLRDL